LTGGEVFFVSIERLLFDHVSGYRVASGGGFIATERQRHGGCGLLSMCATKTRMISV
jgi:hypothetical protein